MTTPDERGAADTESADIEGQGTSRYGETGERGIPAASGAGGPAVADVEGAGTGAGDPLTGVHADDAPRADATSAGTPDATDVETRTDAGVEG